MSERPTPVAGAGEVLIRVAAAGVNRPDVAQRKGMYPPPPGASDIPGLEVAGTVVALGADVTSLALGARVCALVTGGGYAEFCVAPEVQCLPVPRGLTMVEAASLPENYFTVWSNVFDRGRLARGESLLVQGGSSGIGVCAIQLAHALGSRVFATKRARWRSARRANGSVPSGRLTIALKILSRRRRPRQVDAASTSSST